ncbi:uncharacterized protein BX663DRAFT_494665 [Cokeromyces recurvatus]|uniref:uncharacterized protein n=1 Tax=Cokeromyces recurvatus TaxID=90255 RepID=UPI00221ED092|nr:uncharacterized protein BX663DRAFT_494665 [Cokeromyces recurvatus]KAI7907054.1 hypothetical protein BX663DRAFT_494665 [Cokeromyces recurvatus]
MPQQNEEQHLPTVFQRLGKQVIFNNNTLSRKKRSFTAPSNHNDKVNFTISRPLSTHNLDVPHNTSLNYTDNLSSLNMNNPVAAHLINSFQTSTPSPSNTKANFSFLHSQQQNENHPVISFAHDHNPNSSLPFHQQLFNLHNSVNTHFNVSPSTPISTFTSVTSPTSIIHNTEQKIDTDDGSTYRFITIKKKSQSGPGNDNKKESMNDMEIQIISRKNQRAKNQNDILIQENNPISERDRLAKSIQITAPRPLNFDKKLISKKERMHRYTDSSSDNNYNSDTDTDMDLDKSPSHINRKVILSSKSGTIPKSDNKDLHFRRRDRSPSVQTRSNNSHPPSRKKQRKLVSSHSSDESDFEEDKSRIRIRGRLRSSSSRSRSNSRQRSKRKRDNSPTTSSCDEEKAPFFRLKPDRYVPNYDKRPLPPQARHHRTSTSKELSSCSPLGAKNSCTNRHKDNLQPTAKKSAVTPTSTSKITISPETTVEPVNEINTHSLSTTSKNNTTLPHQQPIANTETKKQIIKQGTLNIKDHKPNISNVKITNIPISVPQQESELPIINNDQRGSSTTKPSQQKSQTHLSVNTDITTNTFADNYHTRQKDVNNNVMTEEKSQHLTNGHLYNQSQDVNNTSITPSTTITSHKQLNNTNNLTKKIQPSSSSSTVIIDSSRETQDSHTTCNDNVMKNNATLISTATDSSEKNCSTAAKAIAASSKLTNQQPIMSVAMEKDNSDIVCNNNNLSNTISTSQQLTTETTSSTDIHEQQSKDTDLVMVSPTSIDSLSSISHPITQIENVTLNSTSNQATTHSTHLPVTMTSNASITKKNAINEIDQQHLINNEMHNSPNLSNNNDSLILSSSSVIAKRLDNSADSAIITPSNPNSSLFMEKSNVGLRPVKKKRLPSPWKVKMSDMGDIYYHNPITGEDTFIRPE